MQMITLCKYFVLLGAILCFELSASTFVFKLDAKAGETKGKVLNNSLINEASFRFRIDERKGSSEHYSGVTFVLSDNTQNYQLHIGILEDSQNKEHLKVAMDLWVDGENAFNQSAFNKELKNISDLIFKLNWQDNAIRFQIDDLEALEVPFPPGVSIVSFGLRSAKGEVELTLPNKLINSGE